MRAYLSAKFVRVQNHLINLEAIQQVELRKDGSALVTVPGPRKSLQRIEVAKPFGRELWEFFSENLVVIDVEESAKEKASAAKANGKEKAEPKTKTAPKKQAKKSKVRGGTSRAAAESVSPA